jgi:hypothetical protein
MNAHVISEDANSVDEDLSDTIAERCEPEGWIPGAPMRWEPVD